MEMKITKGTRAITKTVAALLVVILVIVVVGGYFAYQYLAVPPLSGKTIKIGIIGPYTGFGAGWGAHYKEGGIYAVEKLNENGGIL